MVTKIIAHIRRLFSSLFGSKKTVRLGLYGEPNTGKTSLANKISMDWLGKSVGEVSEMPHTTRMIQKVEHVEIKVGSKKLIMNLLDMPGLATQIDYKQFMKFAKANPSEVKFTHLKTADLKRMAKEESVTVTGTKANIVRVLKDAVGEKKIPELLEKLDISVPKKKKGAKYSKDEARKLAEEATKGIVEAIKWLDNVDTVLVMMDSTRDPLTQVNIMLIGNLESKGIPVILVANKIDKEKANPDAIRNAFPQHPVVEISALKGTNLDKLYKAIVDHPGSGSKARKK